MQRRHLMLAGFALATAPSILRPATAQNANNNVAAAAGAPPMSEADAKHSKDTLKVGSLSLAQSRLALKHAHLGRVKQFAGFEVAEQETIADVLKSMMIDPRQQSASTKPPSDDEVMANLDNEGKAMMQRLESLKGAQFDEAYVSAQLEGHQKLLDIQEAYLKTDPGREALNTTKLARGMIKEHLALLSDLKGQVKG